jgi:hypothetical protein
MSMAEDRNVKITADTLIFLCGDVWDEDEWDEGFDKVAGQFVNYKRQGREAHDAWQAVLEKKDGQIAQMLVKDWANQGIYPPDEALRLLKKWFDHLQPVWDQLDNDSEKFVELPPYKEDGMELGEG